MRVHAFASVIISLVLGACNQRNETTAHSSDSKEITEQRTRNRTASPAPDNNDTTVYSGDSLQYLVRDSLELVSYQITPDTLRLVSTSDFLYHPFGSFSTVASFKKKYPSVMLKKEVDSFDDTAEIYRAIFGSSFIKLFLNDEEKSLEIISGAIVSPDIKTNNGIQVGMKKKVFFNRFFKKRSSVEKKDIKVVELISGLNGIQQYYSFQGGILVKIEFDTNYQFSKR